jgi:hypothetical protein
MIRLKQLANNFNMVSTTGGKVPYIELYFSYETIIAVKFFDPNRRMIKYRRDISKMRQTTKKHLVLIGADKWESLAELAFEAYLSTLVN